MKQREERIEDYLCGRMSPAEQEQFEKQLVEDHDLLGDFLAGQKLHVALEEYKDELAVRDLIKKAAKPGKVQTARVISLKAHTWRMIGVAASVSLLMVTTAFLFFMGMNQQNDNKAKFRALRKDLDKIQRNQNAIQRDLNSKSNKTIDPVSSGTGFALTSNGLFVTSLHLVQQADSIVLQDQRGNSYAAQPLFRDAVRDIAILRVDDPSFVQLPALPYSFALSKPALGEKVFTLGFPREDIVYGEGTLSSRTGYNGDTTSCQVSIPLNPGNSGGPLVNSNGQVIGIISGKASETEGTSFAIKSASLMDAIESLESDSLGDALQMKPVGRLSGLSREKQVERIEPFVVMVKVYGSR